MRMEGTEPPEKGHPDLPSSAGGHLTREPVLEDRGTQQVHSQAGAPGSKQVLVSRAKGVVVAFVSLPGAPRKGYELGRAATWGAFGRKGQGARVDSRGREARTGQLPAPGVSHVPGPLEGSTLGPPRLPLRPQAFCGLPKFQPTQSKPRV